METPIEFRLNRVDEKGNREILFVVLSYYISMKEVEAACVLVEGYLLPDSRKQRDLAEITHGLVERRKIDSLWHKWFSTTYGGALYGNFIEQYEHKA